MGGVEPAQSYMTPRTERGFVRKRRAGEGWTAGFMFGSIEPCSPGAPKEASTDLEKRECCSRLPMSQHVSWHTNAVVMMNVCAKAARGWGPFRWTGAESARRYKKTTLYKFQLIPICSPCKLRLILQGANVMHLLRTPPYIVVDTLTNLCPYQSRPDLQPPISQLTAN